MFFTRKRIYAALGATVIIAGAGGYTAWRGHGDAAISQAQAAAHSPTATEVDVATVISKTITDWQSYSGRLEAVDHVDIRPLVPDTIVAVHFKDGALIKKGDPLFTIDPRSYEAEVARDQAQFAAAQARNGYTSDRCSARGTFACGQRDYQALLRREVERRARSRCEPQGRASRTRNRAHQSRLYAYHCARGGPCIACAAYCGQQSCDGR